MMIITGIGLGLDHEVDLGPGLSPVVLDRQGHGTRLQCHQMLTSDVVVMVMVIVGVVVLDHHSLKKDLRLSLVEVGTRAGVMMIWLAMILDMIIQCIAGNYFFKKLQCWNYT